MRPNNPDRGSRGQLPPVPLHLPPSCNRRNVGFRKVPSGRHFIHSQRFPLPPPCPGLCPTLPFPNFRFLAPPMQVYRSSLLSARNERWPRRLLPLVYHAEYADVTCRRTDDGRTDARPLHYAFRYGRGQRRDASVRATTNITRQRRWRFCDFWRRHVQT